MGGGLRSKELGYPLTGPSFRKLVKSQHGGVETPTEEVGTVVQWLLILSEKG